eukprot:COSAG01_NODE_656_length_14462_cov_20.440716_7_plen_98_part_00
MSASHDTLLVKPPMCADRMRMRIGPLRPIQRTCTAYCNRIAYSYAFMPAGSMQRPPPPPPPRAAAAASAAAAQAITRCRDRAAPSEGVCRAPLTRVF